MIEVTYRTLLDRSVITERFNTASEIKTEIWNTAEILSHVRPDGSVRILGVKMRMVEVN